MDGTVERWRFDGKDRKDPKLAWKRLREFWADATIQKVGHNWKFDFSFLVAAGITIAPGTVCHDTMIISQLLRNLAPSHALDNLIEELISDPIVDEWKEIDQQVKVIARAARGSNKDYSGYDKVPVAIMDKYMEADGMRCMLLFLTLWPDLIKDDRLYADYLNEMELIETTQRLEFFGVMVDKPNCEKLIAHLRDEVDRVLTDMHAMFGEFINLNKPDAVIRLLYNRLGLPIIKFTDSGKPAVDKDVLLELRELFPDHGSTLDLVIKHRSYAKGITTVQDYLDKANDAGIIFPTINTNRAKTGRESGENPNMQNVSKNAALKNPFPVPARRCFRALPGHVLYLADYSGIEMRLIVDAAGEEELIALIAQNGDPHALAASLFYGPSAPVGMRWSEADKAQKKILRSAAKNASFALAYGGGLGKIAVTLMMTVEQATPGFMAYCARFPKVAGFTQNTIAEARSRGYITTAFGRKLNVPKDAIYSASNFKIQGTAAGILKRAQNRVDKFLQKETGDRVRIVIPIHDEIIYSYPRALFPQRSIILPEISRLMTTHPEIRVPLDTEWKMTTYTWDRAKDFSLNSLQLA
jgi:DNA polymerase-1